MDLKPIFTREIKIEYIDTNLDLSSNENDEKIKITSLIMWIDNSSTKPHEVELEQILSNWKK
jgi:hypothetical protein